VGGGVTFNGSGGIFAGETGVAGTGATRASVGGVGVRAVAGSGAAAGVTAAAGADTTTGAAGLGADSARVGAGGALDGGLAIVRAPTGACSARDAVGCAAE